VQAEHSSAAALGDGVVTLRPWREHDLSGITAACSDPETALWLDRLPQPYREDDARAYLAHVRADERGAHFAVDLHGELAGSISVRFDFWEEGIADIGYWVGPWARRRGVATRALLLAARWALRQEGVARLQLRAAVDNAASCGVAERAGFRREGVFRAGRTNARTGERIDFVLFSLLPGELT
jgi:RimJ/RimL family protein N-acetyltransferase